ncbi:cysteine protease [Entomophthora muscae]|uniref:Cysteine protease n=1 Tax=Entomophthora muscae TaxID=34485 RepID=A0ACC2SLK0_9FUNG|nr:cysteine protease [Entomophthora muscae]
MLPGNGRGLTADAAFSSAEALALQAEKLNGIGNFSGARLLYTQAAETLMPFLGKKMPPQPRMRSKCMEWITLAENLKKREDNKEPRKLTSRETEILHKNSVVNGKLFLPWDTSDTFESESSCFSDPDGQLELSSFQKKDFSSWKRPEELFGSSAKMISKISCESIVQNKVTNCSFVASLCICASYELRLGKRLITAAIFPQDQQGDPILSKGGKYTVKLYCNGISRKVVIDDFLPTSISGELICTYSKERGELWPSLIEKAFMKLSGGYSFLGSNSSVDLHTLTGWIPEQAQLSETDTLDNLWKRLREGYDKGYALATIGTGSATDELSPGKGRLGLIPSHAYAIVDVREVTSVKLIKLKNPWGYYRWKGAYSSLDLESWTPELKKALAYDPQEDLQDDGIFWIDYASACAAFETLNFNWNPDYFPFTYVLHDEWELRESPQLDSVSFGNNPQFSLEITADRPSVTWVLFTRHVTSTKENTSYLATHLYEVDSGKERIFAHGTPKIKTRFTAPNGLSRYVIVLSQQGAHLAHCFTVRVFSMAPFRLEAIKYPTFEEKITASWKMNSSGGNIASPGFFDNSQYHLAILGQPLLKHRCTFLLHCTRSIPIGLVIFCGNQPINSVSREKLVHAASVYSMGFSCLSLDLIAGDYIVIPTTHQAGESGEYSLKVLSGTQVQLKSVRKEGAGMLLTSLEEFWTPGNDRTVATDFVLLVERTTKIKMRLRPNDPRAGKIPVALSFIDPNESEPVATSGAPSSAPQGAIIEHLFQLRRPARGTRASLLSAKPCEFIIRASGWMEEPVGFSILIYHDQPIKIFVRP